MSKRAKKVLSLVFLACMILSLLSGCGKSGSSTDGESSEPLKIGFVATAAPTEYGYNLSVYNGVEYLKEVYPDAEIIWVDNVPDSGNESATVMENMVRDGCKIIFATSFGYLDSTAALAEKYPDVYFLHCSQGEVYVDNMTRYDITTWDANYVAGFVAGSMSKSGQIGYVAAQPIPTVLSSVNSYALGAKRANPNATINLFFTNSWADPSLEKQAAQSLVESGCDVLGQFCDSPATQQVAADSNVYSTGFHVDMRQFGPNTNLTGFMYNWGTLYVSEVEKYLSGDWKGISLVPGMIEGCADIAPINEIVPQEIRDAADGIKQDIINGDLVVFSGEIKDNEGNVRVAAGETLSFDELAAMDWLVDNVVGASLG